MPSWKIPRIKMLVTEIGDIGVGYTKMKGIPITAVNRWPRRIPLIRDFSSALLVVINIEAKKRPAIIATIFPNIFPEDSLSKKSIEIPKVVITTATISPKRNFCLKIKADNIMMNIGAVY
jgi:hypothetical protein